MLVRLPQLEMLVRVPSELLCPESKGCHVPEIEAGSVDRRGSLRGCLPWKAIIFGADGHQGCVMRTSVLTSVSRCQDWALPFVV